MNAVAPIEDSPESGPLSGLSFQQEAFVLAFMANGGKAQAAAAEAGYAHVHVTGYKLLANKKIAAAVDALRAERRAEIDMALREKHFSKDKVLADLCEMAGFDLGELLDERGIIDRSKLKAHAKQLGSVEIDGAKTKIKAPDRLKAYGMLADLMGWTAQARQSNQINVQVNVGFAERMAARRNRALEDR